MPYFLVMLHGGGIDIERADGGQSICGFYTTRRVRAPSISGAKASASQVVIDEWMEGEYAKANRGSVPILEVESVRPATLREILFRKYSGYTFYTDPTGLNVDMRVSFKATQAGSEIIESVIICGVTDDSHYLQFRRGVEGSEDDGRVYLEYDDQINGGYDYVESCRLDPDKLVVRLSRPLGRLDSIEEFYIALSIDEESFVALRDGLKRVFRGLESVLHTS